MTASAAFMGARMQRAGGTSSELSALFTTAVRHDDRIVLWILLLRAETKVFQRGWVRRLAMRAAERSSRSTCFLNGPLSNANQVKDTEAGVAAPRRRRVLNDIETVGTFIRQRDELLCNVMRKGSRVCRDDGHAATHRLTTVVSLFVLKIGK